MVGFIITKEAEGQLKKIPVLADIRRNVNLGDLLILNKSDRPVSGIFSGFTEKDGHILIELRDGLDAKYVHPKEIATLHAGNGYTNTHYNRENQGAPAGGNSV